MINILNLLIMKKLILCSLAAFALISCTKNEPPIDSDQQTLKDFLASRSENDKTLLGDVIDNSGYKVLRKRAATDSGAEDGDLGVRIKFRWHGTDPTGTGCNASFGICLIFGEAPNEAEEINALATVDGDKLIIEPTTEENGLTSDGYLPVGNFVAYGDKLIKPGIYKGRSEKIVVDLVDAK